MSGFEVAVVLGASLLGAFVKSVTGMGYPLLAVPVITLALGIEDAVVIVAAPNLAANALLCLAARDGRHESRDLPVFLGWGFAGAVVGTFALVRVPEEPLLVALAATIVGFVAISLRAPDLRLAPATTARWSGPVGLVAGVMQGAVGVSGPVVATWLHGYRLPKHAFVFSVTAIFGVTGAVQLALLALAGELTSRRLGVSLVAFLPVLAMVPVGSALRARLSGHAFARAVLAVLVVSGLALVVEVVW